MRVLVTPVFVDVGMCVWWEHALVYVGVRMMREGWCEMEKRGRSPVYVYIWLVRRRLNRLLYSVSSSVMKYHDYRVCGG